MSNFQKAIDILLKPVLGRFVNCYMDDVIITSPSFNEHIDNLNQVFTLLRDAGLTLNKDKCHFARDKLKYLGLIISKDGIETDDNKVKAITEMKPPKNDKEGSKFLGMAGWYQKFIPNYADICELLYRLKKKGAKCNWLTEAHDFFNKVKRALTEVPVLQLPNFQEQFNLFTDASGVGIGAVLNQNHRPIAFVSRTLNKAEVTERECLAVIWALNKEQLIQEQREDPELGHIYRYLENPDDGSVKATVCEVQLKKRAGEEQEYSLTRPERPGQQVEKDTEQLREISPVWKDNNSETLPVLPQKLLQGARRNTRVALESTVYRRTASGEGASAWKS
ncbi:retrovirus-related Pol polyprotein from transposon 297 [Trichonephila clavipes]|nr:retrovirus-related Pol polyprotein from transposon 297 [Trichonephila clavipes]